LGFSTTQLRGDRGKTTRGGNGQEGGPSARKKTRRSKEKRVTPSPNAGGVFGWGEKGE